VCISHDYTDIITCWDLTRGGGPVTNSVIRKFRTGWPIRSLTGYYESPHFAVCGRKWIKVYNTWVNGNPAGLPGMPATNTEHVALYEEGFNYANGGDRDGSWLANDFNHQIWDIIYINTNRYAQGSSFIGGPNVPSSGLIATAPGASERLVSGTSAGGGPFIDIDGDGIADATNAWT